MGEIERDMPIDEFIDWQRFAAEHPFPADLVDIHHGMMMALQANIYRSSDAPAYEARDFFVLGRRRRIERAEPVTMAQKMRAVLKS